jgi:hypothetical protein
VLKSPAKAHTSNSHEHRHLTEEGWKGFWHSHDWPKDDQDENANRMHKHPNGAHSHPHGHKMYFDEKD